MEPKYSLGLAGKAGELLEPIVKDDRTSFSRAGKGFQDGREIPSQVPTFENEGFRVESQRINLFTSSNDFLSTDWTKSQLNITPDAVIGPEGSTNASKISGTVISSAHFMSQYITATSGQTYVASAHFKEADAGHYGVIRFQNSTAFVTAGAVIDLSNGQVVSQTLSIPPKVFSLDDGWYRVEIAISAKASGNGEVLLAETINSNVNSISYLGDGESGVYIWGAQLEEGEFATSYIPTDSSTFTRVEESFSTVDLTLSNALSSTSGSVYFDFYNVPNSEIGSTKLRLKNDTAGIGVYFFNADDEDSLTAQTRDRSGTNNIKIWSPEENRHRFLITWDDSSSNLYYYGREVFSGGAMDTANVISFSSRGRTILYDIQTYNTKVNIEEARKLFYLDSYTELVDQIKYKRL
jgi:hypothetical protein